MFAVPLMNDDGHGQTGFDIRFDAVQVNRTVFSVMYDYLNVVNAHGRHNISPLHLIYFCLFENSNTSPPCFVHV